MKKIILNFLLFATVGVLLTSCLKDKGFNNGEYGINDPDTQPPGVAFPLGNKTQVLGMDLSASLQAFNDKVYVNLESGKAAVADVNVTLIDNTTALLNAYNTANGLTGSNAVLPLPTSIYNVTKNLVIPAGARHISVPLNITNSTSLDALRSYAVGLTISNVDGGYKIASNLDDLLFVFNIKNYLDGVYEITGAALRAGDAVFSGVFGPYERDLATSGASSVQWEGTIPWANGANSQLPGGYEPNITVDPATQLITSITSASGGFMTSPVVRTDIVGTQQRYDPATKTLYFEFSYNAGPTSRLFSFKAKYLHSR